MITRKGMGKGRGVGYYNIAPMDSHIHSLSARGVKTYTKQELAQKFSDFNVIGIHTGKNLQDPKVKGFAIETKDEPFDRSNAIFDRIPEAKNVQAIRNMAKGHYYSVIFAKGKKCPFTLNSKDAYLADYLTYTIYRLDRSAENSDDDEYGTHNVGSEYYLVSKEDEDEFNEYMANEYGYQDYGNIIHLHKLGQMRGEEIMEIAHKYHAERKKTPKYKLDAKDKKKYSRVEYKELKALEIKKDDLLKKMDTAKGKELDAVEEEYEDVLEKISYIKRGRKGNPDDEEQYWDDRAEADAVARESGGYVHSVNAKGHFSTGFSKEQLSKFNDYIKNVDEVEGLTPDYPITSQALVRKFGRELGDTYAEQMHYANQIVKKYMDKKGIKHSRVIYAKGQNVELLSKEDYDRFKSTFKDPTDDNKYIKMHISSENRYRNKIIEHPEFQDKEITQINETKASGGYYHVYQVVVNNPKKKSGKDSYVVKVVEKNGEPRITSMGKMRDVFKGFTDIVGENLDRRNLQMIQI